jgi:predicted O-methyltransferase YrrM
MSNRPKWSPKYLKAVLAALKNLLVASNGLSLGLLAKPHKMVAYAAESWFLYRTLTDSRGVPQKTVFEVLGNGTGASTTAAIKLAWVMPHAGEWFHAIASYTADLTALCSICALIKPKVVFEIGTLDGYTSLHFALNTPADAKVYTLDLPAGRSDAPALTTTVVDDSHIRTHSEVRRYVFESFEEASKIQPLFGDSARFDYAPYRESVDLFFIDGAHSYEYVRQDTLNALKCCRKGGVIAWHDFGRSGVNGVSRWIHELSKKHQIYSVPGSSLAFMVAG